MCAQIGWDETAPADTASVSGGDDAIRSTKTSVRIGMAAEHTWPSAGGDAGIHLLGSARAYVGTQSQVSSSGTDGRLMWASDTSRLFHVGSGGTSLIGGSRTVSMGTDVGFTYPQRHYWAEEVGVSITTGQTGVTITIPGSGYSGIPYIQVTSIFTDYSQTPNIFSVLTVNSSTFRVRAHDISQAGVSGAPFFWRSIGSRVL